MPLVKYRIYELSARAVISYGRQLVDPVFYQRHRLTS